MALRFVVLLKIAAISLPIALVGAAGSLPARASDAVAVDTGLHPVRGTLLGAPRAVRSTCGIESFERRILELVNRLRGGGANCGERGVFTPTRPLAWSERLTRSADGHSVDMATHNYLGHLGRAGGRSIEQRISAAGQDWGEYAENLAAGLTSVEDVLARWVGSPAHCANLMNPNFTEIGAACVPAPSPARFKTYWTMDFTGP